MILLIPPWLKADPSFCRSCHKKDLHRQKFNEFLSDPPVNLVALHQQEKMKCPDCHRGITLTDKAIVLYEEVKNTGKYFLGWFSEPESLTHPFPDLNCRFCHQQYQPESSFHNFVAHGGDFPLRCVECHLAHKKGGNSNKQFLIKVEVFKVCARCHPNWTKKLEQYF